MGATSITGKGPGDSNGKIKLENGAGCCGGKPPKTAGSVTETIINDSVRATKGCSS